MVSYILNKTFHYRASSGAPLVDVGSHGSLQDQREQGEARDKIDPGQVA